MLARHLSGLVLAIGVVAPIALEAQPSSVTPRSFPTVQGRTYRFERVGDGVYYASGGYGCNPVVIVNDDDVLLVDTSTTPAGTRALLADIGQLTDKPVRYVVNTHWHYDHTDGNSVFGPEVKIIAHDRVYEALTTLDVLHSEPFLSSQGTAVPARIASLEAAVAGESEAGRKASLERDLAAARDTLEQLREIKPTPPTVTYSDKLVLHLGGREIDLLFLGRGHTAGDTVVFLPAERIVATGDLMESRLAYMGSAYFDEWIATLDKLKALDFDLVLPGHGIPFDGKALITAYQRYLEDLVTRGSALKRAGVSAEDAAKRIDLTDHARDWPQITGPGADLRGMRRLYAWLDERDRG